MTENQEGLTPETPEAGGAATNSPSGTAGTEQLSEQNVTPGTVSVELFNNLLSEVRGLQSKMDKDAAAVEKRLKGEFEELVERLNLQLTPEQATEYRMYQMEQQIAGMQGNEPQVAKPPVKPVENYAEVFKELGIESPTVDDEKLAVQYADNPVKLAAELVKRQLSKPTPTPASGVVPGNVGGGTPPSADALIREFDSYDGKPLGERLANGKTVLERRAEITDQLQGLEQQ
jgi:hypothetical protein